MLLDRRMFVRAAGASTLSFLTGHRTCALGEEGYLLDQQRIANYRLPALLSVNIMGSRVTYAVQGPAHAPLLLYFHGWGDDYRVLLPLEYPLIEASYRLLVFHRPGYAGTALSEYDWRTAAGQAELAAGLLDYLHSGRKWRGSVIGTSGGAPAALAFAAAHAQRTRALVLQAGVTSGFRIHRLHHPREHSGNARGEINDARSIYFSRSKYCRWDDVSMSTLVVHDSEDTFVPFVHAEEAAAASRRAAPLPPWRPHSLDGS